MLTEQRFAEIAARNERRTQGTWLLVETPGGFPMIFMETGDIEFNYSGNDPIPDADFIANAPTDITDLLAEVDRLKTELAQARAGGVDAVDAKAIQEYIANRLIIEHPEFYVDPDDNE